MLASMEIRGPAGLLGRSDGEVIDLTADDVNTAEHQIPPKVAPKDESDQVTFISRLAHRAPSSVPQKRKSPLASDVFPAASANNRPSGRPNGVRKAQTQPATPSPTPSLRAPNNVSVVIPSPSAQQKRLLEAASREQSAFTGLSETYYPVDDEKRKARQRAYPHARKVDRAVVSLRLSDSSPVLARPRLAADFLRRTLDQKLAHVQGPPISYSVENDKLLARLAANFEFINDYKIQEGVTSVEEGFNAGCDCKHGCDPTRCFCLNKEVDSNDLIVPYQPAVLDKDLMILRPDFLHRKSMIFECNYRCSCAGRTCWNHVVQRGRTVRLEIFDTGERGFGLRSPDRIVAGQFIDRYLGEVITKKEADARENIAATRNGQSYLFSLDFMVDDERIYVVDGQKFGSATRFMNHSCNPNCKIVPVSTINHADNRLYDLAFFARRNIPPGAELTFDYNPAWDGARPKKVDPSAVKCLCREKNCRGQLWPNARKGRQQRKVQSREDAT